MPSYVTPRKNAEFIFYDTLVDQADTKLFKSNPTLASGDFKVSIDGGSFNNPSTLPTVTPAAGKAIKVTLSAAEMNGDNIMLIASDAAGAEWCDKSWSIQTSVRQIDDLAYPTTSGRSLDVTATGAAGIDWGNVENPTTTLALTGTSTKSLQPTVAGRTLDVSAAGEAGIDWANIGSPTTTQNLSGTSIAASPATLSAGERNAVADALLDRNMATGTDSGSPTVRTPRQAFRALRNKTDIAATVLTVYKEDDTTTSWDAALVLNSSAVPITQIDPAS